MAGWPPRSYRSFLVRARDSAIRKAPASTGAFRSFGSASGGNKSPPRSLRVSAGVLADMSAPLHPGRFSRVPWFRTVFVLHQVARGLGEPEMTRGSVRRLGAAGLLLGCLIALPGQAGAEPAPPTLRLPPRLVLRTEEADGVVYGHSSGTEEDLTLPTVSVRGSVGRKAVAGDTHRDHGHDDDSAPATPASRSGSRRRTTSSMRTTETFTVTVTVWTSARPAPPTAEGRIRDDDATPVVVHLRSAKRRGGRRPATFTVLDHGQVCRRPLVTVSDRERSEWQRDGGRRLSTARNRPASSAGVQATRPSRMIRRVDGRRRARRGRTRRTPSTCRVTSSNSAPGRRREPSSMTTIAHIGSWESSMSRSPRET